MITEDDLHGFYLRGVSNWAYMPHHIFLKRAQWSNSYFCGDLFDNSNEIWFSLQLPKVLLIRNDGWEVVFPYRELPQIYHSFMKRGSFYMAILSTKREYEYSTYGYSLQTTPQLEDLGMGLL